jgi:ElaA protein
MIESKSASSVALEWRWKPFSELNTHEVYAMLRARSMVFVVEQNCLYNDIDGLDLPAWHLFAYDSRSEHRPLAGYLRVLLPDEIDETDETDASIRIGRVLTTAAYRGMGLGSALLNEALTHIAKQWPGTAIRLHAQAHLQGFYGAFGFQTVSDIHDEDGIAHVWMRSV